MIDKNCPKGLIRMTPVDAVKAGVIGGVIGGLAGGGAHLIGTAAQGGLGSFQKELARSLAHGSIGGLSSMAQGSKFKHGFFAGSFASMAGSGMQASNWGMFQTTAGGTVAAAVVGGTASALGGGKFANGAVTGAYTMLFNHMMAHQPNGKQQENGRPPKIDFDSDNIVRELLEWYKYREESSDPFTLSDMFTEKTFSSYGGWYVDGKRKAVYQGQMVEIRVKNILDLERNNQSLYINSVNYFDKYFNAIKNIDFFLGGPQCGNCRWPTNYVNIRFFNQNPARAAHFEVYGSYPK